MTLYNIKIGQVVYIIEDNQILAGRIVQFSNEIEEMFIGNLKQGDRLIESSIATRFNVSHAPVREAMYILEKKMLSNVFQEKVYALE